MADTRSELIILVWRLGPTDDDLTKNVLADHVGVPLVQNQAGLVALQDFFAQRQSTMTPNNLQGKLRRYRMVFALPNRTGLAIGCLYIRGEQ